MGNGVTGGEGVKGICGRFEASGGGCSVLVDSPRAHEKRLADGPERVQPRHCAASAAGSEGTYGGGMVAISGIALSRKEVDWRFLSCAPGAARCMLASVLVST